MPELPEVEVVRTGLHARLAGAAIIDADFIHHHFQLPEAQMAPLGQLAYVRRHGKWLLFAVRAEVGLRALVVNLGMSGRFEVGPLKEVPKHTRWRLLMQDADGKFVLNYVDPRCMGRVKVLSAPETVLTLSRAAASRGIGPLNMGPDWLSPLLTKGQASLRINVVRVLLCDTYHPIKRVLLDQSRLAGLGNIYASEMCHRMHVHPERPADSLTRRELTLLATTCPEVLQLAIKRGGTSLGDANSYVDVRGRQGSFAELLRVYGRNKQACYGCSGQIVKTTLAGRSTFFCSKCQT